MKGLAASLTILGILSGAVAQAAPEISEAKAKAREEALGHSNEADNAYRRGDFERAMDEYGKAYRLYSTSLLLYDMAQAARRLGQVDKARDWYRQCLATASPTAPYRASAERWLTQLPLPSSPVPSPPPVTVSPPKTLLAHAPGGLPDSSPSRPIGVPELPYLPPSGSRVAVGLGLSLVGSLIGIGAWWLYGDAATRTVAAESAPTLAGRDDRRNSALAERVGGIILLAAGVTTVLLGSVILGLRGSNRMHASLGVAPGAGGLTTLWRF